MLWYYSEVNTDVVSCVAVLMADGAVDAVCS
jgi:hypothetical protein